MKILLVTLGGIAIALSSNFLEEQKRNARVKEAITKKQQKIRSELAKCGLETGNFSLLVIAFKDHDRVDLYVRHVENEQFMILRSFPICSRSGTLGPKRRRGDYQVPEGFYHIDRFNPYSNYHLSLGINYPNTSDRRRSTASNLGGDIFIHGSCATVGCLPMTDDGIKEIYLYAVHARNNGQMKIPVYIFPFEMTDTNFEIYCKEYGGTAELIHFWTDLKEGYNIFMRTNRELQFAIAPNGEHVFEP